MGGSNSGAQGGVGGAEINRNKNKIVIVYSQRSIATENEASGNFQPKIGTPLAFPRENKLDEATYSCSSDSSSLVSLETSS